MENEAINDKHGVAVDIYETLLEEGDVLARQTWAGGSWSIVIGYKGRYFSVNEAESTECGSIEEAFNLAGIGNDRFDKLDNIWIKDDHDPLPEQRDTE